MPPDANPAHEEHALDEVPIPKFSPIFVGKFVLELKDVPLYF